MIRQLSPGAPEFPPLLASISDVPKTLYVRGRIPDFGGLALVGTRRPTAYGLRMARALAAEAARAGIPTISGLARGIDTEVHRATLDAGGRTWAVLGSGLDRIYPPENAALADEIVAGGGGVLSEFPMSEPPLPSHFPRRNRIISGLSWGTLVVEGDVKSGALITAKIAANQGRDVLAVPGPADAPLSEGPHNLIKDGAVLVRRWGDVLDAMPVLAAAARAPSPNIGSGAAGEESGLPADEALVMKLLGSEETPLEDLLERTGFAADRLAFALIELEIKGHARSCPGQRYAKN